MATETADGWSSHLRGLTVTTLAAVAGVAAAFGSSLLTSGDPASAATSTLPLYVLAAAIVAQLPVLRVLGIEVEDFSAKDYLYVAFMTFSLWFVSWAILLTSGVSL